jgi:adenosylhomocysteine nucleosidase
VKEDSGGFVLVATGLAREARIAAGPGARAIAVGVDARRLAIALEREIAHGAVAVMSFGLAGGLAPGVAPGTSVLARGIVCDDGYRRCDERWTQAMAARLSDAIVADLASRDAPLADVAGKRSLHAATGAVAVDTESHVAARVAQAHGLPFAAFRVVVDPADRALPPAAARAIDGDGRLDWASVLRSFATTPSQLPLVVRSALDARAAFAALLRGRRRLGPHLGCDPRTFLLDVA